MLVSFFLAAATIPTAASTHAMAGERSSGERISEVLDFGEHLLEQREYYRAITEFQRALFLSGTSDSISTSLRGRAVLGIGNAYYSGDEFERASGWLLRSRSLMARPAGALQGQLRELLYFSLIRSGDSGRAVEMISSDDPAERPYYLALASAFDAEYQAAIELFESSRKTGIYPERSSKNIDLLRIIAAEKTKSPKIAAVLAVVPGLGYLYSGHKSSALSTFLINGLLIGSSIDAYDNEQYVLSGILGFISLTWYTGNFYGSASAARRYNHRISSACREGLVF